MRITPSHSFHTLAASSPIAKRVPFIHGIDLPGSSRDWNLPSLVSIRRNLIPPAASSESLVEVGIGNEDDETLKQVIDLDALRTVQVRLELRRECQFGEQFLVAGDHPVLGSWSPLEAAPMEWTDSHVWTAELDLPVGELIQFKFILRGVSGEILWQPGPNRVFETTETSKVITVFGDWEKVAVRQVTEERKDGIQDKESDEVMIHGEQQARDDTAGSNREKQLSHVESYNGDVASLNGQEMDVVVESIQQHALQDSGHLREEIKVKVPRITQVVGQRFVLHDENEEVAVSNTALKRSEVILEMEPEIPVLVPGLTPCLITLTEDVTSMEDEVKLDTFDNVRDAVAEKCEPECLHPNGQIQSQFDPKQEEADEEEEEAVTAEVMFEKEHPNSRDEPVQELQLTIYAGQDSRNNILHNYIRQGRETVRRFLNKLGFQ